MENSEVANPKVQAIQQDVENSYNELNRMMDNELATLPSEKLYLTPFNDEWTIMESLAHITEFMTYWADEIAKLVAQPGINFGRTKEDPYRIAFISNHSHDQLLQIKAALPGSYQHLQGVLSKLQDRDLDITGNHSKFGERSLAWFVEEFVTGHFRNHLTQLREALAIIQA